MVDVVQSVGRAMRKADGKQYGYIIIPISIPADVDPEKALNDNKRYKVVWDVCQALRAHDDRFEATVNKIKFNINKPDQIDVTIIGAGKGAGKDPQNSKVDPNKKPDISAPSVTQLKLDLLTAETWQNAILGKIAKKCGSRDYWENWAKDVSVIAASHIDRINLLLRGSDQDHQKAFEQFVKGLRKNLNPSVTEEDAIEMLAQHLITRPVFDALFEGYEFAKNNPVSKSFKKMIDLLEDRTFEKDQKKLDEFYDSVRRKVVGIDNSAAKQTIIKELYDKFFNLAFPRMADRLGIVYTPIEVVDFIINSADVALKKEFNLNLTDRNVHILDPFTGTGTFMVRLLQSGHIKQEDLEYKYLNDLHANEIVLLAYYIAAINIEETYHDLCLNHKYVPFDGMVLADTFQIGESKSEFEELMFPENNKRVKKLNETPIQVVIGNPPYSAGQDSENEGNKNLKYAHLDQRIRETYAERSNAGLLMNLYDSYIRAIRWATDRIKDKGIICYVTNNSFIDKNSMDGFRGSLADEFSSIYVFNLRGGIRGMSKELAKKEGQNVFDIMTGVAVFIFVKNPEKQGACEIYYHDIGDSLNRAEKLEKISTAGSIDGLKWEKLNPNDSHDWINQRDPAFLKFIPIGNKGDSTEESIFNNYSLGVVTNRDSWAYNFSSKKLVSNMESMINFYNQQVKEFKKETEKNKFPSAAERQKIVEKFINTDPQKISWTRAIKNSLGRYTFHSYRKDALVEAVYRPFCKSNMYFDKTFNEMVYQMPKIFPNNKLENLAICVPNTGARRPFSALMVNRLPDLNLQDAGAQSFSLFTYEKVDEEYKSQDLFAEQGAKNRVDGYTKNENISDTILNKFCKVYKAQKGETITKEDIFYYIYGIFHSPEYKKRFDSDLKKLLPRIPLAKDFWAFSKAGRQLSNWHINYELAEPYNLVQDGQIGLGDAKLFEVTKAYFPKINGKEDKTTIIYNNRIKLGGIPLEAYDYVVNGKSAIEWVLERYQVSIDKDSGIINNPNDWSSENNDPEYIINLIMRVVRVSLESIKIINCLPKIEEMN